MFMILLGILYLFDYIGFLEKILPPAPANIRLRAQNGLTIHRMERRLQ